MAMIRLIGRRFAAILAGVLVTTVWTGSLLSAPINVPNASFELPTTNFPSPNIHAWQKSPKPDWYDESGGFFWSQLTGAFRNPAPGSADHIDNCDGSQALWLFAVREVGFFQDYNSVDWDDPAPTHAFNVRFNPGKSYLLTVAILVGAYPMSEGASMELSLYYRDAASNRVTVAATTVSNTPTIFNSTTHFLDFQVSVPPVKASDAWANQHIGVQIRSSITTTNLEGGYWDLDNVRLEEFAGPTLAGVVTTNGQFQITVQSEPGLRFEILAATNITQSISNWVSLEVVTNTTGTATFTDTIPGFNRRFYRARQLP